MPKYKVKITFDRVNPASQEVEKNSVRENEIYSTTANDAKQFSLRQFKKNEPTRRKIHSVEVTLLEP